MVGSATAAIFAPMMATVTGWFDTHRSLAVSLVSAGMGMAPMTMSPIVARLVSTHDWRTTMLIVAGIVAAIMIPVSLLVRRPPALAANAPAAADTLPRPELTPRAGDPLAAVHHSARHQLLLLRHPFRPDHPHRQLRHQLRHSAGRGGVDLQRRGPGRTVRPHRLWSRRRSLRRQARAGHRPSGAGVRRAGLRLRARARRLLLRGGAVRLRLCRHHAALRGAGARELSAAHPRHRHRRHRDGRQPRHGDGAIGRRPDLRHLCELRLALYRLMGVRARRLLHRDDVPAVPEGRRSTCSRRRCRHRRLSRLRDAKRVAIWQHPPSMEDAAMSRVSIKTRDDLPTELQAALGQDDDLWRVREPGRRDGATACRSSSICGRCWSISPTRRCCRSAISSWRWSRCRC